ncbi:metallophosphoesterase [Vagococcus bubulae]|uniref:Calcineurin-like phosphoesterase domain-containing protein n=1 Tax=Vagococcus bubulae TaxID=1977868 RepID=A0A429ZNL2_9ENTE|nr:metallophosphoesterase [Vagococcus bubulae]RST95239.1 hypothetical protein CBF36_03130 [Vagococcus bubulae]
MTKVKNIITGVLLSLPLLMIAEGIRENRQLDTESIIITSNRVNGQPIKIAQLSDLQFPRIRVNQTQLLNELDKEKPDVLFLTGDTIDRTETVETTNFFNFLNELTTRYPTYVVNGNHEETNPDYVLWKQKIKESDAIYLENNVTHLSIHDTSFNIVGLSNQQTALSNQDMTKINPNIETLILAHHPELFHEYLNSFNQPLAIFSGHAHGGQWRFPGTDGLLAPDQGILPKLTSGLYIKNDSHLIVSRGLANSTFPIRLNNYPHLIFTTIQQA